MQTKIKKTKRLKKITQDERYIVDNFSREMLNKIYRRYNRYSPMGWKTLDLERLFFLLEGELNELKRGIEKGDSINIRDESIDIANYACFIYEISKIQ